MGFSVLILEIFFAFDLLPQLLVNKTLYEKTLASGFGSVHFLLDASEQQQARYLSFVCSYSFGNMNE